MTRKTLTALTALPVLFAGAWGVTTLAHSAGTTTNAHAVPAAARTSLPGLSPAAATEPELPSLAAMAPRRGTVVQAPGPFDDRFTMSNLRFDGRTVRGSVTITSDVSDVLEFQAVAGFYDTEGNLLGTGRYTYHLDEGHEHAPAAATGTPDEVQRFTIAVPGRFEGKAAAASVGVPVLVNE
jgi:hypothetical protein